ncbi:hypothetical protein [Nocardioides marmoribigeumensis]|uniref:Sulfotransferase family protein n=1 Tax=Nocardioides marmoribigeumensis TaxID=433649 RepID=A0ABU2BWY5_9ACTN|nr:hypothetical protein [Nocardioides marmoribigeumensis]MDR7362479.1 hypothetical protein [Nocardioides marmoribigeumensis]
MRRVVLHVGTPKTGTSFVQDLLFQQREALAAQGVLYPADRFDAHFLAALDLMELRWGGLEHQAVGAWDRLAQQVRAWEGHTVIVSHEILARASVEQVRLALESFGADREVHVVLSARDLVRQIPAEWQENVKHRRTVAYRDFLDQVTADVPETEVATWFWGVQEVPAILGRWGGTLPPEHVHVVTVPKPGSPRSLLWERFAGVFGLDPQAWASESERANPSLGAPETALVRAINQRVNGGVLANDHYRDLVRETLAHRALAHRRGSPRLFLPPDVRTWATDLSHRWIAELEAREYDVVGSLEDLRPDTADATGFVDPDEQGPADLVEPMMDAVVTLLQKGAELREEVERLHQELDSTRHERDQAYLAAGLLHRAKHALVRRSETHRTAHLALKAYRRARGR